MVATPQTARKGRTPYPLAPNQPQGQRATRYKDPTYTPQQKALLDWYKKLPGKDQQAIQEQASKPKPPIGPSALMDLMQEYKALLKTQGRAPRTLEIYASDLVTLYRFTVMEERDITEMSPGFIHDYCEYLTRLKYYRSSVSRKLTDLKLFLRFLFRQGVLNQGQLPPASMFITKVPKAIPNHLTMMEVQRLIEAPDDLTLTGIRDRAILEVLYGAGLRVSEVVNLDVGDLELKYKTLLVRQGKGGVDRWGRYGNPARQALVRYLQESRPDLEQMSRADFTFARGKRPPQKDPNALFLNCYGERISVRMVQMMIREYAALVGIHHRVYPHLLRHSFATHMMENGASIPVVKELLGHKNITTTQVYTHVSNVEAKKTVLTRHPRAKGG